MKKLLVILMVVAMASFLFVGCLPGVTPEPEPEPEPEPTPTPTTVAPVITAIPGISITSTATQYINNTESSLVTVSGTAPTYSEIKVYIDDICAGTGDTGVTGTFSVVIAKADLGADGAKTLYATAKEAGLAVSPKSVEYAFILDTVAPKATELKATAAVVAAAATCPNVQFGGIGNPLAASALSGTAGVSLVPGAWLVECLGANDTLFNVVITSPSSTQITYSIASAQVLIDAIPGVTLTFNAAFILGHAATVTVTAAVTGIVDRATVLFDEDVTYATATTLGNYAFWNVTTAVPTAPAAAVYVGKTAYFNTFAPALALYDSLRCVVGGITDLAGNTMAAAASVLNCTVMTASATALAP